MDTAALRTEMVRVDDWCARYSQRQFATTQPEETVNGCHLYARNQTAWDALPQCRFYNDPMFDEVQYVYSPSRCLPFCSPPVLLPIAPAPVTPFPAPYTS